MGVRVTLILLILVWLLRWVRTGSPNLRNTSQLAYTVVRAGLFDASTNAPLEVLVHCIGFTSVKPTYSLEDVTIEDVTRAE